MDFLFKEYFYCFLHPIKTHGMLREIRGEKEALLPAIHPTGRGMGDSLERLFSELHKRFVPFMGISWLMAIFQGLYALLGVAISSSQLLEIPYSNQMELLQGHFKLGMVRYYFFFIILQAIFFPLFHFIYLKGWHFLIQFFTMIWDYPEKIQNQIPQVINIGMTANGLLIIPLIGPTLREFGFLFYLYFGLHKNLGLTKLESFTILISPLVILFLIFMTWLAFTFFGMNLFFS